MNKKILVANWKMNTPKEGMDFYFKKFFDDFIDKNESRIIFAPSFPFLKEISVLTQKFHSIFLAGQNCCYKKEGAYTGEVSASMVRAIGAQYVIVGHSERRAYFREDNDIVAEKVKLAWTEGLTPIVCVGEDLEQRKKNQTKEVITSQVGAIQGGYPVIFAYEPIWAIGTGIPASPGEIIAIHRLIRELWLNKSQNVQSTDCTVIYGGSVKSDMLKNLLDENEIQGALVGGASLDPLEFASMAKLLT
jgi:triosephosphate isomerase